MKRILIVLLLLITSQVQAQTVHRWNYELNNACSQYASTEHTPRELFTCLIYNTKDYYIWRHGWETKVETNKIMGVINIFQPDILDISYIEKENLAQYYNKELPQMYKAKMLKRKNLDVKYTQAEVNKIWNARL